MCQGGGVGCDPKISALVTAEVHFVTITWPLSVAVHLIRVARDAADGEVSDVTANGKERRACQL